MSDRLTPALIRGARGMLGWSMLKLASAAQVSVATVKRVESPGSTALSPTTFGTIQGALETAGIEFLPDEGRGPGLRLNAATRPQASVFSRFL